MRKKHPALSEDFNFDEEFEKSRLIADGSDDCANDSRMQPVNETGYPFNPSAVNYGSNNYNWGFEYKICPLSTNLSQKGNDRDAEIYNKKFVEHKVYVGDNVTGTSPQDNETHTGKIVNFTFTDTTGRKLKFVWILDSNTRTRVPLNPHTVKKVKSDAPKHNGFFNLFASNYMHCHESVDLFGNGDQFFGDPDDEYYRDLCISQFKIQPDYVKYYDEKFSGKYRDCSFKICSIGGAGTLYRLFGLSSYTSDITQVRSHAVKLFIDTYFALTDRPTRSSDGWRASTDVITAGKVENSIIVESWQDIYNLFRSVIRVFKSIRMGRYYTTAVVKLDNGKQIVWNDNYRNKYYIEWLRKHLLQSLFTYMEYDSKTGESVKPEVNTDFNTR